MQDVMPIAEVDERYGDASSTGVWLSRSRAKGPKVTRLVVAALTRLTWLLGSDLALHWALEIESYQTGLLASSAKAAQQATQSAQFFITKTIFRLSKKSKTCAYYCASFTPSSC